MIVNRKLVVANGTVSATAVIIAVVFGAPTAWAVALIPVIAAVCSLCALATAF